MEQTVPPTLWSIQFLLLYGVDSSSSLWSIQFLLLYGVDSSSYSMEQTVPPTLQSIQLLLLYGVYSSSYSMKYTVPPTLWSRQFHLLYRVDSSSYSIEQTVPITLWSIQFLLLYGVYSDGDIQYLFSISKLFLQQEEDCMQLAFNKIWQGRNEIIYKVLLRGLYESLISSLMQKQQNPIHTGILAGMLNRME